VWERQSLGRGGGGVVGDPLSRRAWSVLAVALLVVGSAGCGGGSSSVGYTTVNAVTARSRAVRPARGRLTGRVEVVASRRVGSSQSLVTVVEQRGQRTQRPLVRLGTGASMPRVGQLMAYVKPRRSGGEGDLVVSNADGSAPRLLTDSGLVASPAFSGNGVWIAYSVARHSQPARSYPVGATTWLVHPDGKDAHQLKVPVSRPYILPSDWSPDGSRIALNACARPNITRSLVRIPCDVYLAPVTGGRAIVVRNALEPAWSPDGRRIAYVTDADHNGRVSIGERDAIANELYVLDIATRTARRITFTNTLSEQNPSWMGDNSGIVYDTQNREYINTIAAISPDGRCKTIISPTDSDSLSDPAWVPNANGHLACR